jgi:hypothetical protein
MVSSKKKLPTNAESAGRYPAIRIPSIGITDLIYSKHVHRGSAQYFDGQAVFKNLVKYILNASRDVNRTGNRGKPVDETFEYCKRKISGDMYTYNL